MFSTGHVGGGKTEEDWDLITAGLYERAMMPAGGTTQARSDYADDGGGDKFMRNQMGGAGGRGGAGLRSRGGRMPGMARRRPTRPAARPSQTSADPATGSLFVDRPPSPSSMLGDLMAAAAARERQYSAMSRAGNPEVEDVVALQRFGDAFPEREKFGVLADPIIDRGYYTYQDYKDREGNIPFLLGRRTRYVRPEGVPSGMMPDPRSWSFLPLLLAGKIDPETGVFKNYENILRQG